MWLKNGDPVSSRGWACFWFYLALAFWKAAGWALASMIAFGLVEAYTGQPPTEEQIIVMLAVFAGGLCLSVAIGVAAVASALRGKGESVNPSPHAGAMWRVLRAMGNVPGYFIGNPGRGYRGINHAIFIVATSTALPLIVGGVGLLRPGARWGRLKDDFGLPEIVSLIALLSGSSLAIPAYGVVAKRVIARTPAECWAPARLQPTRWGLGVFFLKGSTSPMPKGSGQGVKERVTIRSSNRPWTPCTVY